MTDEKMMLGFIHGLPVGAMMRRWSLLASSLLFLILAGTAVADTTEYKLDEAWRIGRRTDNPDELFGVIIDVAQDAGGRTHVLDLQLAQVSVFDADGGFLFAYGGEGEGPGDLNGPRVLFPLSNDGMGVQQPQPLRLSTFDVDGRYLRDLHFDDLTEPATTISRVVQVDGGFLIQAHGMDYNAERMIQTARIIRCDPEGKEERELARQSTRFNFAEPRIYEGDPAQFRWAADPAGRLYLSVNHDYELSSFAASGISTGLLTREYEPRSRSEAEKSEIRNYYLRGGGAEGVEIQVHERHRAIRWLSFGPRGLLWVLSDRGARVKDALGRFDLFEAEGRYLKSVTLKGEGTLASDRFVLSGGQLFVLRHADDAFRSWQARLRPAAGAESEAEAEPEPMSVIAYELPTTIWE